MHITDYPLTPNLTNTNVFLVDGDAGTKTILAPDVAKQLPTLLTTKERVEGLNLSELEKGEPQPREGALLMYQDSNGNILKWRLQNTTMSTICDLGGEFAIGKWSIFVGNNLGSVVTDEQWAEIKSGSFKNMFIGDYWYIGGISYHIVDFDYWYRIANHDELLDTHHVVLAPMNPATLYSAVQMQTTATTNGGYIGTNVESNVIPNIIEPRINAAFGSEHILPIKTIFCNSTINGRPTGIITAEKRVIIPTEMMLFGCRNYSSRVNLTDIVDTYEWRQLGFFRIQSRWVLRNTIWTSDICDSERYVVKNSSGQATRQPANGTAHVLPIFAICSK